jgi:hypothetical protein
MNPPNRFARPAILVLSFGLAAACGRVPGQFEIVSNQVPGSADGCHISTDETVYAGQGTMDLRLVRANAQTGYLLFPLLKNNLPGAADGPDINRISLSSFAVDITLASAPPSTTALFDSLENGSASDRALLHFKTPWSGTIGAGGKLAAGVTAFPVALVQRISALQEIGLSPSLWVNLRVRAFGSTSNGAVESDPFEYPLAICSGCLIASVQACPATAASTRTGNPCNVAQDQSVDCCQSGNDLFCPSVVAQ